MGLVSRAQHVRATRIPHRGQETRSREGPTFSSCENRAVWISQNTNRVSAGDMEVSSPTITKEQTPYRFGSRPVKSVCPSATVGSNGINERRMGLHVASGVAKAENAVSRFLSRLRPAELLSGDSNLSLGQSNDTDFLASIYAEQTPYRFGSRPVTPVCPSATVGSNPTCSTIVLLARGVTGNTPAFDVGIERSNRSEPASDTFRPRRRVLLQRANSESGDLSSFMARRVLPGRVGPLPRGVTKRWTMTGRSEGRRGQASLNTNWHAEGALVRTPGFHSGNDGSSPFEVASSRKHEGRQRMVALQGIVAKKETPPEADKRW